MVCGFRKTGNGDRGKGRETERGGKGCDRLDLFVEGRFCDTVYHSVMSDVIGVRHVWMVLDCILRF